jgi:hypothetical protein
MDNIIIIRPGVAVPLLANDGAPSKFSLSGLFVASVQRSSLLLDIVWLR